MLYPKPCYNESCYKEIEVYVAWNSDGDDDLVFYVPFNII